MAEAKVTGEGSSLTSTQPARQTGHRRRDLIVGVGAVIVVLVLLIAPALLAFAPLSPAYKAGRQGVADFTKKAINTGTTGGGVYSYSNPTGGSAGWQYARSPAA